MNKASVVLLLPLAIAAGRNDHGGDSRRPQQCSLYLAPSSGGSAGKSGMGVYAGVDYAPGSVVGPADGDVVIPLIDASIQIGEDWGWSDYFSESRALGVSGEGVDVGAAALGLGSLARGNGGVESSVMPAMATYDNAGLHRSSDPNAGGISYYHGMKTVATRPIEAGSELFSDLTREVNVVGAVAPGDDENDKDGLDSTGKSGAWGMLSDKAKGAFSRMLPKEAGPTQGSSDGRTPEWLSTHGYCLDNIAPGPSTVQGAGRGAFATRPLQAGEVIAPAPVIHLPDRNVLDIRSPRDGVHNAESQEDLLTDEVVGRQLLLNYCFGRSDSSMLLCPVGSVASLINHAPSSASPNAEIRWSKSTSTVSNATWLDLSPADLESEQGRIGLVLEYVALRDIGPGEEIFIDYGRDWEEAWEDHADSWSPTEGSEKYADAAEWNERQGAEAVRTIQEEKEDPYPSNVQTSCYYEYIPEAGIEEDKSPRIVSRRWSNGMDRSETNLRPCRILKRYTDNEGEERYVARILNGDELRPEQAVIPSDERVVVNDIPRRAVKFTNRPYTTDVHLPNVFRHEMMAPDGVFPEAWKNLP